MKLPKPTSTDALIVVDMQYDFIHPDGALYVAGGEKITSRVAQLVRQFPLVVATQDWHPHRHVSFAAVHGKKPGRLIRWGGGWQQLWDYHCVQQTRGARLNVDVGLGAHLIIRKGFNPKADSYSAFRENPDDYGKRKSTGLMGYLFQREIKRVFICGLAREYCVKYTALDAAHDNALETYVLWSATRPVDIKSDGETYEAFSAAGVKVL